MSQLSCTATQRQWISKMAATSPRSAISAGSWAGRRARVRSVWWWATSTLPSGISRRSNDVKTRPDMDKIARGLGAERRGKVAALGGYFGAVQLLADIEARLRVASGGGGT